MLVRLSMRNNVLIGFPALLHFDKCVMRRVSAHFLYIYVSGIIRRVSDYIFTKVNVYIGLCYYIV